MEKTYSRRHTWRTAAIGLVVVLVIGVGNVQEALIALPVMLFVVGLQWWLEGRPVTDSY